MSRSPTQHIMSLTASITKIAPKQADSNAYKEGRILLAIEAIQKD